MVKFMKRIPAGTFLVPMLLSALLYTIWPEMLQVGGITEAFLGGGNLNFVIGLVTFISGVGIDIKSIPQLLKRHGLLSLLKLILSVGFGLGYIALFGLEGIFGISALAFVVTMASVNSALYVSLVKDYGDEVDQAAFGMINIFSIPVVPVLVFAIQGSAGIDLMPVVNILIPLVLGIVLGNIDTGFRDIFGGGVSLLIPVIGWKIGQSLNLVDAVQEVFLGALLVLLYYVLMSPLVFADQKLLKQDGVAPMALNAVAALSSSFPAIIAGINPELQAYVTSASAQVLAACLITVIVTPIITKQIHETNK